MAGVFVTLPVTLGLQVAHAGRVDPTTSTDSEVIVPSTAPVSGVLPDPVGSSSGQDPFTVADALTRLSDDEVRSRLKWLRDDGVSVPMLNGGTIPLGDGYEAVVEVDPYPPVNFDPVTVTITLARNGSPVTDASLSVRYDMLYMKHGPFPIELPPTSDGTYTATYHFFMFGPWGITADMAIPGVAPRSFTISILVWPN